MKNYLKQTCLALLMALLPLGLTQAVYLNVADTVAGDEARLQVSGLLADETVQFTLDRPEGVPLNFALQADAQGVISDELYGLHLKHSGVYELGLKRDGPFDEAGEVFVVQPGEPSRYRSEISTTLSTLPADGVAVSHFTVRVLDAYGNPVPGQTVKMFSSRNEDMVNAGGKTDEHGVVKGKIYSTTPGISVLSALVGDEMVFQRPELVFHLPATDEFSAVGQSGVGSFLKAQLFSDDFEEVAFFALEKLPTEVQTGQAYTFGVVAKDKNGSVVKNYAGKVRFSSDDNGAQLPIDYQFTETDQGQHEFAVAVVFSSPGQHSLAVVDINNPEIKGEVAVDVLDANGLIEPPLGDALTIITPAEGTYSSPRMTITGRGPAGVPIKITDGPITLVENLTLDVNGDFVYQTPALADGRHVFRAEFMDGSTVSNQADIRIDNTPPRVLAVEVDPPTGVAAGGTFRVNVSSNEALSTATCTFNGVPQALDRSGDVFTTDIVAGNECGNFPLSCTVADILGNELVENAAASIQVCGSAPSAGADADQDGLTDQQEGSTNDEDGDGVPDWLESNIVDSTGNGIVDQKDPNNDTDGGGQSNAAEQQAGKNALDKNDDVGGSLAPTAVGSLNATPGENRITLYWAPAKDDQAVAQYKILYGEAPDQLTAINLTPDARTQWYVDNLATGTRYFFRVIALDSQGNEGPASNLVEATTNGETLHSAAVPESGADANIWGPLVLAILGGGLFLIFSRKRA